MNKVAMMNKRMELEREIKELTNQLKELDEEIDLNEHFRFFYDDKTRTWHAEHDAEKIKFEYIADDGILVRSNIEMHGYYVKTDNMCNWKLRGSIPEMHILLLERRIRKVEDFFVEEGFKIFRR